MATAPSGGPPGSLGISLVIVAPRTGEWMIIRAGGVVPVSTRKISSPALLMSVTWAVVVASLLVADRLTVPEPTMLVAGQPPDPFAVSSASLSVHWPGTLVSIREPGASVVTIRCTAKGLAWGSPGLR